MSSRLGHGCDGSVENPDSYRLNDLEREVEELKDVCNNLNAAVMRLSRLLCKTYDRAHCDDEMHIVRSMLYEHNLYYCENTGPQPFPKQEIKE